MVSSISSSSANSSVQQLMNEMRKKMQSADTDGTQGLSKEELSSIDTGDDKGGARFLQELQQNFSKIDTNGDGQLTDSEIDAAKPEKPQMGPPPGMMMEYSNTSTSSLSSSSMEKILEDIISSSDTDGVSGLSKDELSTIDTGNDPGKTHFIDSLTQNFDKLDTNADGQLSQDEIKAGRPQGPPPMEMATNSDASSNDASTAFSNSDISAYLMKLLSAYQNNSSDITSTLNVAG